MNATLTECLRELHLPGILNGYEKLAEVARRESFSYERYLQEVLEEDRVLARLHHHSGKPLSYRRDAVLHEIHSSVGVVHVPSSMKDIQNLRRLFHGSEERIVTALAFLLRVISYR